MELVECLEAEGCEYVFSVPGEETLDILGRKLEAILPGTACVFLLKNDSAYWILDGNTFSAMPIPEVTPNPYELHWDRFAWLPGGEIFINTQNCLFKNFVLLLKLRR